MKTNKKPKVDFIECLTTNTVCVLVVPSEWDGQGGQM